MTKLSYPSLAVFLLVMAAVAFTASIFQPGSWYAALERPAWTPPNAAFPIAWTILYALIGVAGWLIWGTPGTARLRKLWIAQLVLNGLWSWVFFGLHLTVLALVDLTALVATVAALIVTARPTLPWVSGMLAPYLVWISYAWTLNLGIIALNR